MARDGYPFIVAGVCAMIGAVGLHSLWGHWGFAVLFYLASLATMFVVFFFRDPERTCNVQPGDILSPGDGRVVAIVDEHEPEFFNDTVCRISIFLSVFDVHVNRIPVSGTVAKLDYRPGAFKAAFLAAASTQNEQTVIGIENGDGKVLFKQIAGLIARRIVCRIEEGNAVSIGDRFGMIRFGSRVDVLVPKEVEILVVEGQRVKGGATRLGRFSHES